MPAGRMLCHLACQVAMTNANRSSAPANSYQYLPYNSLPVSGVLLLRNKSQKPGAGLSLGLP